MTRYIKWVACLRVYRGLATPNRKADSSPLLFLIIIPLLAFLFACFFVFNICHLHAKSDMEKEESEILKELQYQNRKKNILVSLILVFFFGPLGLFYTNSIKALCMLLLLLVTIPLSIFRIYSNLIEFRITDELILWCVFFCMYWLTLWAMSVVEVNNYNAILQSRLGCKRI